MWCTWTKWVTTKFWQPITRCIDAYLTAWPKLYFYSLIIQSSCLHSLYTIIHSWIWIASLMPVCATKMFKFKLHSRNNFIRRNGRREKCREKWVKLHDNFVYFRLTLLTTHKCTNTSKLHKNLKKRRRLWKRWHLQWLLCARPPQKSNVSTEKLLPIAAGCNLLLVCVLACCARWSSRFLSLPCFRVQEEEFKEKVAITSQTKLELVWYSQLVSIVGAYFWFT